MSCTQAAHPDDENSALLAWLARGQQCARRTYPRPGVKAGSTSSAASSSRPWSYPDGRALRGPAPGPCPTVLYAELRIRILEERGRHFHQVASRSSAWRLCARHPLLPARDHHFRFTGTSRDGHGHHQVAGIITQEAFKAAADPSGFPEYGKPWQAKKLYLNVRGNEPNGQGGANANARGAAGNAQTAANSAATPVGIPINVGEFDAASGTVIQPDRRGGP